MKVKRGDWLKPDFQLAAKYKLYKSLAAAEKQQLSSVSSSSKQVLTSKPRSTASRVSTPTTDKSFNPFLETSNDASSSRLERTRSKASTPVKDDQANPFLSPSKPTTTDGSSHRRKPVLADGTSTKAGRSSQPSYLFAHSPSRLKTLLSEHSPRSPLKPTTGIDGLGITPRTKARKRLRGEVVEDTPKKARLGSFTGSGATRPTASRRNEDWAASDIDDDDDARDDDDDEVLGPTPRKSTGSKSKFRNLLDELDEEPPPPTRKRPSTNAVDSSLAKMFKKPASTMEDTKPTATAAVPVTPGKKTISNHLNTSPTTPLKGKKLAYLAQLDSQQEDALTAAATEDVLPGSSPLPPSHKGVQVEEDLVREIEFSDEDDPDAYAGQAKRIKIEPYRLDVQRRLAAAALQDSPNGRSAQKLDSMHESHQTKFANEQEDDEGATGSPTDMSRLSIHSPTTANDDLVRRTMEYHNRRAMAIFSNSTAKQLERERKGIDVVFAGQSSKGHHEDHSDQVYPSGLHVGGESEVEEAGDDDWDSEPEGWKNVGLSVEDDW